MNTDKNLIFIMPREWPITMTGNAACLIRDKLLAARADKKLTLRQIKDRLTKIELPDWLQSQILQMSNYRKYDRITCPVEQAMEAAVNFRIVSKLMDITV